MAEVIVEYLDEAAAEYMKRAEAERSQARRYHHHTNSRGRDYLRLHAKAREHEACARAIREAGVRLMRVIGGRWELTPPPFRLPTASQ